ncbi:MAG: MBL fold metallo-hydrolase [Chitinophagaceae bacterium]|uniref:MBL fold metallo-hydrolase n=1 Tax=unclassified Paraflavitalea TaxID=2798305 RepID=UPI003D33D6BE|nr:MBL fold metallo-hydrolase [Chitinophagaceae bacterium]
MFIQQLYTGCLSEAAYYIESDGKAAIIDPMRDIDVYLNLAKERGANISYVFETHFHADFVSGHLDLSKATGAPIIYGPETNTKLPVTIATDGQVFQLGSISIEVMHTPGHTLESTCYLLKDENGLPYAVFTGDTLFVGDVGRPDLAQKGSNLTMVELAGMLYDSLQKKIVNLPDEVLVYPAHGAGSSCGKNLGPETYSTIGVQKQTNYALQAPDRDSFIRSVTDGLQEPPSYFPINVLLNKEGYDSLEAVLAEGTKALSMEEFKSMTKDEDVIVLDTRHASKFVEGFIPGSIFIGLEGRFAEWAGSLLSFEKSMVLVTEPGMEKESVVRLARVGFSKIKGYLSGGYEAWQEAGNKIDMIINVEADELAMDLPFDTNLVVLDVRKEAEYADGHVKGAVNMPLIEMTDMARVAQLEDHLNIYVHCAGGYRSVIGASMLKRQGIHNLRNVEGGWAKIKDQKGIEVEKVQAALN